MAPSDFSMTFKFTGFPEIPKDVEPNAFLELNRKQEVYKIFCLLSNKIFY